MLLRLYPRRWRARYEDEVLALVDDTGLDARRALDLSIAAGREWMRLIVGASATSGAGMVLRAILLPLIAGVVIAALGTMSGHWLTRLPTPATVWIEGGQKVVAPPHLPGLLAGGATLLQFAVLGRTALARGFFPGGVKVSFAELGLWLVALFVASSFQQWFDMVLWDQTGVEPWSLWEIWSRSAVMIWNSTMFLYFSTRAFYDHVGRQRELVESARVAARAAVTRNPLGLR